jgi:hypothetical protein
MKQKKDLEEDKKKIDNIEKDVKYLTKAKDEEEEKKEKRY